MTAPEAPRKPKMHVMHCPYGVEGGNFKAVIGQAGSEPWYMCARCGHLTWPSNRFFKCTCAKCVRLEQPNQPVQQKPVVPIAQPKSPQSEPEKHDQPQKKQA